MNIFKLDINYFWNYVDVEKICLRMGWTVKYDECDMVLTVPDEDVNLFRFIFHKYI